jgi:hypothetical protein
VLELLPAPETAVAVRASGRIDESDVQRGIEAVEAALARHERIALYAEVEISGVTPGALVKDVGYGLGKLRELRRFARAAVVTSQDWVRWIARAEAAVLPQIEIRIFGPAERDEALAWAAQPIEAVQAESVSAAPSIQLIETTARNVLAFEVDGRIRAADMRHLIAAADHALKAHERLRLLVRVVDFDGVTLEALREEGLASLKMRGWRQVERYALVGGPAWMRRLADWSGRLARTEIRHFDPDQEHEAWRWIEAQPQGGAE